MKGALQKSGVYDQIATLEGMNREELVQKWTHLYGSAPFKGARKVTLIRGIAYELQCKRLGELKPSLSRELLKLAASGQGNKANNGLSSKHKPAKPVPKIKVGSRLIREWNGRTYSVSVTETGFEMAGTAYSSLSAVAKAITGTQWSGPRFFGVRS